MNTTQDTLMDTRDGGIGSLAPDFELMAADGRKIRLSDFRGRNNVVLFFVREYI